MADLRAGGAFVELSLRTEGFQKSLDQMERRLSRVATSITSVGRTVAAFGAAGVAGFVPAIKAASDFEETMSKFSVVFGEQTDAMREFSDELAEALGRSRLDIAGFLSQAQGLFVPLGFDRAAAAELSKTMTQLAVDLASFNNAADSDAFRDLFSGLLGSTEALDKYSISIREASVSQELLRQNINPKEATEAQKVMARLSLIVAQTTDAQGDAIRTADSFANTYKRLTSEVTNAGVAIGNSILPIVTDLASSLASAVQRFQAFAESNQQIVQIVAIASSVIAVAGGALIAFGLAASGAASVIGVLSGAVAIIGVAIGGITAPILIAGAAIGAFLALFVDVRGALGRIGEAFSATFSAIATQLTSGDFLGAFQSVFSLIVANFLTVVSELIRGIGRFVSFVVSSMVPLGFLIGDTLTSAFDSVANYAEQASQSIVDDLKTIGNQAEETQRQAAAASTTAAPTQRGNSAEQQAQKKALEEQNKLLKEQQDAYEQLQREGQQVFESTRTPAERYRAELQRLDDLFAQHVISQDTLKRAYAAAREEYLANNEAVQQHKDRQDEARAVVESVATAQERHAQEVGRLNSLYRDGYIDRETYNRAIRDANEELRNSNEGVRRAEEIFNSTRTAAERFEEKFRELQQLARDGLIDQDTFDRAVRDAERERDLANGQAAGQDVAQRIPTVSSIFGGARASQIFGASDTIAKQQLTVQQQMLDETKRTRQAIERRGLVFN